MRQAIRALVELAVAHVRIPADHRQRSRSTRHLRLDPLV
jgi:hypothetical protein